MQFEVPDCEPEDLVRGGLPRPGFHHAQVIEAEEDGQVALKFEVIAGPDCGKQCMVWLHTHSDDPAKQKKMLDRLLMVALRLGLVSRAAYADARRNKQPIEIDFTSAVGCQAIIELEEQDGVDKQGNPKKKLNLAWAGVYELTDPKVAKVPRNDEVAGMFAQAADDPFGNPKPAAAPAAAAKPQPAMAGAAAGNGSIYDQI